MNVSPTSAFRRLILAGAGALAVATIHAQTPPASTSSAPKAPEEAVQLSAFMVTAEDDQGYYSPQSVSGTRTKTELLNLPMNLNVLTEQFIKDISASDLVDIVTYTAGLTSSSAT